MVHGFGCEAGAVEVLRRGYQRRYAGGTARRGSHQTSKGQKVRRVSTLCFFIKVAPSAGLEKGAADFSYQLLFR